MNIVRHNAVACTCPPSLPSSPPSSRRGYVVHRSNWTMIDDVMSAPPFTLFPSSFLHRSFLLLLAGSRGSNPPRAEHRARGTQSSSFPLLPLSPPPSCPLLSSFPLPSPVVNLSLLLRHSQTAHPPPSPPFPALFRSATSP